MRWPYPAAGKECAAVANKLTQAQRGCRNVITVVADNFNAHKIHAPTANQAAALSSCGSRVGSFALNENGSTGTVLRQQKGWLNSSKRQLSNMCCTDRHQGCKALAVQGLRIF